MRGGRKKTDRASRPPPPRSVTGRRPTSEELALTDARKMAQWPTASKRLRKRFDDLNLPATAPARKRLRVRNGKRRTGGALAQSGPDASVATIVEVARRAGVSVSTVSYVVNGTRFVSPTTARRVTEAIADVGYQPTHRPRAEARLDQQRRSGALGHLQPLLQRHHLRSGSRVRPPRPDGLPFRHAR